VKPEARGRDLPFLPKGWRPSPGEVLYRVDTDEGWRIKAVGAHQPTKYCRIPTLFIDAEGWQSYMSTPSAGLCWSFVVREEGLVTTPDGRVTMRVMPFDAWLAFRKSHPRRNIDAPEPTPHKGKRPKGWEKC